MRTVPDQRRAPLLRLDDNSVVAHKEEKRAHIAKEIAETEQSYLQGLRTCISVFMEPLQRDVKENPKTALLSPDKINTMFGNMAVRVVCALLYYCAHARDLFVRQTSMFPAYALFCAGGGGTSCAIDY